MKLWEGGVYSVISGAAPPTLQILEQSVMYNSSIHLTVGVAR